MRPARAAGYGDDIVSTVESLAGRVFLISSLPLSARLVDPTHRPLCGRSTVRRLFAETSAANNKMLH